VAKFAIIARDRADAGSLRADTRPRHLDHLRSIVERIAAAGPIDDESGKPVGSIIIAEFDDIAAARAFADADPYAEAGLFSSVTVEPWRQVFPKA
jgi:uncharacterized protein YciI